MLNQFSRTELLFGKEAMERLAQSRVAVFGVGGVGGYAVEALVRSGVGAIDIIDDDKVCLTNLNRLRNSSAQTFHLLFRIFQLCRKQNPAQISDLHSCHLSS